MVAPFSARLRHRLRRRHRVSDSSLLRFRQDADVEVDEEVHDHDVNGCHLSIGDSAGSWAAQAVVDDLRRDAYELTEVPFLPGEVAIDVGAHVGVFSTYLAKQHPAITIYAFEPVPPNFALLVRNLERNHVPNVVPVNMALTADGRSIDMAVHLGLNSGGASAHRESLDVERHRRFTMESVTLDDALDELGVDRVKLLKIDCEGSEHEILTAAESLRRVEYLRGEFHINPHLEAQGHSIEGLVAHCEAVVDPAKIAYVECRMAD